METYLVISQNIKRINLGNDSQSLRVKPPKKNKLLKPDTLNKLIPLFSDFIFSELNCNGISQFKKLKSICEEIKYSTWNRRSLPRERNGRRNRFLPLIF